jgi:carbonic anhydrase
MTSSHVLLASLLFVTVSCSSLSPDAATLTKNRQTSISKDEAQQRLQRGNARFVAGRPLHRDQVKQVEETSHNQFPFASVVSCIDSRTSTELIFDQGIGDVFNARVAGNIVNADILGSLEYASKVAGSKLIAVIGHTHCGAIKGACDHVVLGNLTGLLSKIEPAVAATPTKAGEARSSKNAAFVDHVAEKNVLLTMANIRKQSAILNEMEKAGQIKIVGGMYDIETGKVTFLE